jgi:uncharacterized membrane protein
MSPVSTLVLAVAIGFVAGLRSLTAPAVVAWAAFAGALPLRGTSLAFMGTGITVLIATVLAIVELITDKLPTTPNRTAAVGLGARILMGGLSGAAIAAAGAQSLGLGAVLGAAGGLAGAFAGYRARTRTVKAVGRPFAVALLEDAVAVAAAFGIVSRF